MRLTDGAGSTWEPGPKPNLNLSDHTNNISKRVILKLVLAGLAEFALGSRQALSCLLMRELELTTPVLLP